jgi:DOPA 4,5-dioxygenase
MTFRSYHAHVYYDESTRKTAKDVRIRLRRLFRVRLGRWRDLPVGPHPQSMYQVAFSAEQFPHVVPWLMEHHAGLSVLIHPDGGDDLRDHSGRALWLGEKLALRLDFFREPADC